MQKFKILIAILTTFLTYGYADLDKGKQLHDTICFTCHGVELGGGIGPNLIDSYWKHGDTKEEVSKTISEGIYDSDMVAFKNIFSKADINSITEYILSKQQGLRSVKRHAYADSVVTGELDARAFSGAKILKTFNHPENVIYHDFHPSQVSKIEGLLYIPQDDTFHFDFQTVRLEGQVSIFIGDEERFNFESKRNTPKHKSTDFSLKAGVHKFTLYHQKVSKHKLRRQHIFADLISTSGLKIKLFGDSMVGASPKAITAGTSAKVIRKNIQGLSPRSVIAVLPNKVILAINTEHAGLEKAWHSAKIDLTKSIMLRGRDAAVITGPETPSPLGRINRMGYTGKVQYLASHIQGANLVAEYKIGHIPYSLTYSPYGANGYSITAKSTSKNIDLEIHLASQMEVNGQQREGLIRLSGEAAMNFTMRQGK